MIVVAYLVAFFVAQIGFLLGFFTSMLVSLALAWIPGKLGAGIRGIVCGALAAAIGVISAKLALGWFGVPLNWVAVFYWLAIPIYNDFRKGQAVKQASDEIESERVRNIVELEVAGTQALPMGYFIGACLAGYLLMR